jgi:hypothetical protein
MPIEIGEAREEWGKDVVKLVENFANAMKNEVKPFYIVYACKEDRHASAKLGKSVFRQTIKAYHSRPTAMLGILVWFVNHPLGEFRFIPELSAPWDVPLDPTLLSDKASDASERVAAQGSKLNVLVS